MSDVREAIHYFANSSRREVLLPLASLIACLFARPSHSLARDRSVTLPPNAKRIYEISIVLSEDDEPAISEWSNEPAGPRMPGPFKPPIPNYMNVGTGFSPDTLPAVLKFDGKPRVGEVFDAYKFAEFWCVSEEIHDRLLKLDKGAFDSIAATSFYSDGSPGPNLRLMEVVRYRDCLDEECSLRQGARAGGPKMVLEFNILNRDKIFFEADKLGDAKIFRVSKNWLFCLCTEEIKNSIEVWGGARFRFSEVGWLV